MKWLLAAVLTVGVVVVGGPAAADEQDCPPPFVYISGEPGVCVALDPPATPPPPPVAPLPEPTRPDLRPDAPRPPGPPKQDHRPCVSKREFNGMSGYVDRRGRVTKAEVEERWEVVGRGVPGTLAFIGPATIYKRCGYKLSETWYAVAFYHGSVWVLGWPPNNRFAT